MTQLLAEAIKIAQTLPPEDQDLIALTLLQAISHQQNLHQAKSNDEIPDPKILDYMDHQAQLFDEKKSELLDYYLGKYIFFENGTVIDSDDHQTTLVLRIIAKYGLKPMFIKKVVYEEPQLNIRGFKALNFKTNAIAL